jgi:hypothetical protein
MAENGTWGGLIEGHAFDLADWTDGLIPPYEPWVEQWTVGETVREVLRSRDLDEARDSQGAHERATLLIAKLRK